MNLNAEKAILIERFKKVNDKHLIQAIKNMLDYALNKEKEIHEVPESHQKLVMNRFDKVRKNPENLLDWEQAKTKLKV